MSERMIELQRARLLAAGKGGGVSSSSTSVGATANGSLPTTGSHSVSPIPSMAHATSRRLTPQQAAAAAQRHEDLLLQRFLHRLQNRNDNRAQSTSGPTVPTALSRRLLQRQGVGYLDDTVAAIVSGAADRFLGTVLQQAAACRDQRLKGAEMALEARRQRKRHMQQYEADVAERTRRRIEIEQQRQNDNLAAISTAEAIKKGGSKGGDSSPTKPTSKKKKKVDPEETQLNGNKKKQKDDDNGDDDEGSYDSIDEEEDYYRDHLDINDGGYHSENVDDEEDDEVLILRDIARPLQAWNFHLNGKLGLDPTTEAKDHDDDDEVDMSDDEKEEDAAESALLQEGEEGDQDSTVSSMKDAGTDSKVSKSHIDEAKPRKSTEPPSPPN